MRKGPGSWPPNNAQTQHELTEQNAELEPPAQMPAKKGVNMATAQTVQCTVDRETKKFVELKYKL